MIYFLRLIRFPNILIIALTFYLVRFFLMKPMLQLAGYNFQLGEIDFSLLVLSVLFTAAAGYIINDYFDTEIDKINKPEQMILGKALSRHAALVIYCILNAFAIIIGFFLAIKIDMPKLGLINLLSVGLLLFYSSSFKKMFLVGNLIIAFLSSIIPVVAGLFEPAKVYINFGFIIGYAVFAFIISLIREIIKDIEDLKGDAAENCKTIPVVLGVKSAKIIVLVLTLITIILLGYIQYHQFITRDIISFCYFMGAIQLPMLFLLYMIVKSKQKKDFHKTSNLTKLIMLTGIFSMVIFYYSL